MLLCNFFIIYLSSNNLRQAAIKMFGMLRTIFKYKEKESPDKLGLYPERVHVNAMPERRYLWVSRMLVISTFLSICLNAMLALGIYLMVPQVSAAPRFFQINKYFSKLEPVQPAEIRVPVTSLIIENYINTYIMLRYIISGNMEEMNERWGPGSIIHRYSSELVWKDFNEGDKAYFTYLHQSRGVTRNVMIDWVKPLARGVWFVQFRTLDLYPRTEVPDVNIWRVTMRVAFRHINWKRKEDAVINPYGFTIVSYSVGYFGKDDRLEGFTPSD